MSFSLRGDLFSGCYPVTAECFVNMVFWSWLHPDKRDNWGIWSPSSLLLHVQLSPLTEQLPAGLWLPFLSNVCGPVDKVGLVHSFLRRKQNKTTRKKKKTQNKTALSANLWLWWYNFSDVVCNIASQTIGFVLQTTMLGWVAENETHSRLQGVMKVESEYNYFFPLFRAFGTLSNNLAVTFLSSPKVRSYLISIIPFYCWRSLSTPSSSRHAGSFWHSVGK